MWCVYVVIFIFKKCYVQRGGCCCCCRCCGKGAHVCFVFGRSELLMLMEFVCVMVVVLLLLLLLFCGGGVLQ